MAKLWIGLVIIVFSQPVLAQHKRYTSPDGMKYKLVFKDDFSGRHLNRKKWAYRTDSKHWSTQLPGNVTVSDGFLHLHVKKEEANNMDYTGSGIISKRAFKFGYYEARFNIPPGAGWHTSFWLMFSDGSGGTGPSKAATEFDICENDSKNKTRYSANTHNWKEHNKKIPGGHRGVITPDLSAGFHTWGCELRPDKINYYFDSRLVLSVDARSNKIPFDRVNIWMTTIASHLGGTKAVDDQQLPSSAEVDYIRYYKPLK